MYSFMPALMAGARASVPDLEEATYQTVADADGDQYQVVQVLTTPAPELDTGSTGAGGSADYEYTVQFTFCAPRDDFVLKWMRQAASYWTRNRLVVDGLEAAEQYPGAVDFRQEERREPEGSRMYRGLIRIRFTVAQALR